MSDSLDIPKQSNQESPFEDASRGSFLDVNDLDRERLSEALQELLSHGSIIGADTRGSAMYHWCRQNPDWLKESAALVGLDIVIIHEERLVQAIPSIGSLKLKLKKEDTLVWLALWYAADSRLRDEGEAQVFLTVSELNALISDQLLPDAVGLFPKARLRQILNRAVRYNLIRVSFEEPFEESGIEILPSLRRVVPFRDFSAWNEAAKAFVSSDGDDLSQGSADDDEKEEVIA